MTRKEYLECLQEDLREYPSLCGLIRSASRFGLGGGIVKLYVCITHNYSIEFIRHLRRTEYYVGKAGPIYKLLYLYSKWRLKKVSAFTGITVPPLVCGPGLTLYHYGSIVVNGNARIGKNCCIQNNVNIGNNSKGSQKSPQIGDNVYIGPGAVLYGDITIADNCFIGANAVVNKSVTEEYSVIAGVPAKVIRKDTKNWLEYNSLVY